MPPFILKPVVWNDKNYERPAGITAGGYSTTHGFGHEEWNNCPRLNINGRRLFYTNYISRIINKIGTPFLQFMISSHERKQHLVGISGRTYEIPENERQPAGHEFLEEAWKTASVANAFNNNIDDFRYAWDNRINLKANSYCPAEYYIWLQNPIEINPKEITGKDRFISMFSSYQRINEDQAISIMNKIPKNIHDNKWHNIIKDINDHKKTDIYGNTQSGYKNNQENANNRDPLLSDIDSIENNTELKPTERSILILSRIGQGEYRQAVMSRWNNACAITGCTIQSVLQACHIKPWRDCSDYERRDPANGIILTANLHALYDAGLLRLDYEKMVPCNTLIENDLQSLGITRLKLQRNLENEELRYLC